MSPRFGLMLFILPALTFCAAPRPAVEARKPASPNSQGVYQDPLSNNNYGPERYETSYFKNAKPQFNVKNFLKTIESRSSTMESAIALVPADIRRSYTLMYLSGSLQQSSFELPRALVFSPTSNFVMSFNGHIEQAGGDRLEIMDFDYKQNLYNFYEIKFAGGKATHELNPKRCFACHTDVGTPNWRPYQHWPGAYGSMANAFYPQVYPVAPSKEGKFVNPGGADPAQELNAFKAFLSKRSSNPRYAQLVSPLQEPFWPFRENTDGDAFDVTPNRRLGIGLTFHHARRMGALVEKTKLFHHYPANIIANLLECENPAAKEFDEKLAGLYKENPNLPELDTDGLYGFLNHLSVSGVLGEYWITNHAVRGPAIAATYEPDQLTTISFTGVFEMNNVPFMAGIYLLTQYAKDHAAVSTNSEGPTVRMAKLTFVPVEVLTELNKVIPLYEEHKLRGKVCPNLEVAQKLELQSNFPITSELSQKQLARFDELKHGVPYVLNYCIACHSQDSRLDAPFIPFDRPDLMKKLLHDDRSALLNDIAERTRFDSPHARQMPKGFFLVRTDWREALLKYLSSL